MRAILILWLNPERNYVNPIGGVDYQILVDDFAFPSDDVNFNPTLSNPNEEILCLTTVSTESVPDMRIYSAVISNVPTLVKNSTYTFINEFQTSTHYVFKSLPGIIDAIEQRESEANLKVRLESKFDKLSMVNAPIMAKYGSATLTSNEQKIYDRTMEVQSRTIGNDENARRLIDIATANSIEGAAQQAFAINSGWFEDGITPLDIPFNELTV